MLPPVTTFLKPPDDTFVSYYTKLICNITLCYYTPNSRPTEVERLRGQIRRGHEVSVDVISLLITKGLDMLSMFTFDFRAALAHDLQNTLKR